MIEPRKKNLKRGFWDGIELNLLIKGISLANPKISPNGAFLTYTLGTEHGSNIFIFNIETKESYQLTDSVKLSTGTPYGGGVLTWTYDSKALIFSTGKGLYKIMVAGGLPKLLIKQEKAFSPFSLYNKIVYSVEEKDSMALMQINHQSSQTWPIKIPIEDSFLYDPVINVRNGSIAVHSWSFPNMSWNGSKIELLTPVGNGTYQRKTVAGSDTIATAQPKFSPDGNNLTFLNEENGWRNLWIADAFGNNQRILVDEPIEHAYSTWVTGESNYAWLHDNQQIVFTRNKSGLMSLAMVDVVSGKTTELDYLPTGEYSKLSTPNFGKNLLACLFSNYKTRPQIIIVDLDLKKIIYRIRSGLQLSTKEQQKIVKPEIISYPTSDGQQAHGLMYVTETAEDEDEKIPCIFLIHGGPTGMHLDRFHYLYQYFASRGWAVFAVNHRGSVGYGRKYREILNNNWGKYDVDDTYDAYKYLVKAKNIDPNKSVIMGASAGGFTTLMFLIKYPEVMKAGINLFGVSDLFKLDEETHYLESHYTASLIGDLPEMSARYFQRSPIFHAEKIRDPLLIFQGDSDQVVPKNQSETMKDKIEQQGGLVKLKIYDNEGHGFRKFETIKDYLETTMKFLKLHVLYSKQ